MVLKIDTENNIIYVSESVDLKELVDFMQKKFKSDWIKFKLCAEPKNVRCCYPWQYTNDFFYMPTVTCDDTVPTTTTTSCTTQGNSFGTGNLTQNET